jgi:hypothetical protein
LSIALAITNASFLFYSNNDHDDNHDDGDDDADSNSGGRETTKEGQILARVQHEKPVLSYSYMMQHFRELATILQSDQQSMLACVSLIEQLKDRARRHQSLEAYFYDPAPTRGNGSVCNTVEPVSMVARTPRHRNQKRKKPSIEKSRRQTMEVDLDQANTSVARKAIEVPKRRRKQERHCSLCKQLGHQVARCPSIAGFNGRWLTQRLPAVSRVERSSLATSLGDPMVYTNAIRSVQQTQVFSSLPAMGKDAALVIHRRIYIDVSLPQKDSVTNFAFECTVFSDGGVRIAEYDYALFAHPPIAEHITKSKQSLVMSLLMPISGLRTLLPPIPNNMTQDTKDDPDDESLSTVDMKTDDNSTVDTKTDDNSFVGTNTDNLQQDSEEE